MIVVDASCLYEALAAGRDAQAELCGSLRPYDALSVALAEALDATLVTLDRRLARAAGPRCAIEVVGS